METGAFNEIMNAAFEYADAYCASGDEPRRYSAAIDHLRKTVRAEIARFSRGNYAALPATKDSSAGDLASGSENAVKDFMALIDDWSEKDFAAAEARLDPWSENDPSAPLGMLERLDSEARVAREAIEAKLIGLLGANSLKAEVQAEPAAGWLPYSRRISLAVRHGQKLTSEFNALVSDVIASYLETHGHFSRKVQAQPADALDAKHSNWLTVVYWNVQPGDEAREIGSHPKVSALSWSHALHDRDAAMAAAQEGGKAAKEA